jgi:hypothetical protein
MEVLIEAGLKLVLKVGGSTITMTPASIEIKTSILKTDAVLTDLKSSAILNVKGGIILLNS